MTIHHTRIEDAVILHGWAPLSPAFEVTTVPVQDSANRSPVGTSLFARLNYDEALEVAKREGARLIAPSEVELLRQVGVQLTPYLGTPTAENDIIHSQRHDDAVWSQLQGIGWDGKTPVAGAGKHWVDGAPAGRSRLMGWDVDGAGPGLKWWQPDAVAHNRLHFDDGTTTMLVRARTVEAGSPSFLSMLAGAGRRLATGLVDLVRIRAPQTLGEALLEEARKDLGVKESGGINRGPEVDAYNLGCGVPMGSPWCASSLTAWLRRAVLRLRTRSPIIGGAGAKRIMFELQKAGRWFTADEIRRNPMLLRPGMIHCWDRVGEKGHVGVHESLRDEDTFNTVEGNSGTGPFGEGNRVAEMVRRFDDPRWLGAGWVD